jgi:hypothetical protein
MEPAAYKAAYQDWEIRRATLASDLRGQFVDPAISNDWIVLSDAITELYALSGTPSDPYRTVVIDRLRAFYADDATDWSVLHDRLTDSNDEFQKYFSAWWKLRQATLRKTGELSRRILLLPTTAFG